MNLWQQYITPHTASEALRALVTSPGPAFPIAGGTDLLLDLEQGRHAPAHTLVDLTAVQEMTVMESRADHLFIGAAVPLCRIVCDPLVIAHASALVEACGLVGGPQVRNVATLGGNVAHALPAADGTIALLALDALVEIIGQNGTRLIPIVEFFVGPGRSVLVADKELILGFEIPLQKPNASSAFQRVMRPQGVGLPIINLAVWLRRNGLDIMEARIAIGPGGPIPWRAHDAERVLSNRTYNDEACQAAIMEILANISFRSSPRRSSAEYRRHLVGMLFQRTLQSAWERAG